MKSPVEIVEVEEMPDGEWILIGRGRDVPAGITEGMSDRVQMQVMIDALRDFDVISERAQDAVLAFAWRLLWYRPGPVGGSSAGWWER